MEWVYAASLLIVVGLVTAFVVLRSTDPTTGLGMSHRSLSLYDELIYIRFFLAQRRLDLTQSKESESSDGLTQLTKLTEAVDLAICTLDIESVPKLRNEAVLVDRATREAAAAGGFFSEDSQWSAKPFKSS